MKTIFIRINRFWIALEAGAPKGNPVLEISLGLLMLGFLIAGVVLA
jgi:hypothetical protein